MSLIIIDNQLNQKQFKQYQEEFLFFHYCQLKRIEEEGKRQSLVENIKLYLQSCFQIINNLLQSINDGYSFQEVLQQWEKNKQQQLVENDYKIQSLTQHQLQSVVTTNSSNQSESSTYEKNHQQSQFPKKDEEVVSNHSSNQTSQDFNNDRQEKQLDISTDEENQQQSQFNNRDQVIININSSNQQTQNNDNKDNHKHLDKQLESFTQAEIQEKPQFNETDEGFDKKKLSRLHQNNNHNYHQSIQLENSTLEKNQEQSYLQNKDQNVIQNNQSSQQTKDYDNNDYQSNQKLISSQKQISQQITQIKFKQNQTMNDQQSSSVKNQINNNDYQSQNQQQIQTQKQISIQTQQQIQFYVYEDLNNLMEVLADLKQTFIHLDKYPNHPYIPIAINRLIQQVNLSNMIHFDCTQRFKNKDEEYFYQKEKENAFKMYIQLINEIGIPNIYEIDNYLKKFEQNFAKVNVINQLDLLKISEQGEFNQKVIQQVFEGIQHVDNKQGEIKKGKYLKIGYDQIKNNIEQRELRAAKLLKQNFPILNQTYMI